VCEYFTLDIDVQYDVGFRLLEARISGFIHRLYCLDADEFVGVKYQMWMFQDFISLEDVSL